MDKQLWTNIMDEQLTMPYFRLPGRFSCFRNLVQPSPRWHTSPTMSQSSQSAPLTRSSSGGIPRPQRIKLRGSVLVLIRLPNHRQLRAHLHQLSVTGGLVHLEKPLDEKLRVELIFQLGDATIREQAEILFPMWATQGWLQPFRFVDLPEAGRSALQASLLAFIQCLQAAAPNS